MRNCLHRAIGLPAAVLLVSLSLQPAVYALRPQGGPGTTVLSPPPPAPARMIRSPRRTGLDQARAAGLTIRQAPGEAVPHSIRGPDLGRRGAWSGAAGLTPRRRGDAAADAVAVLDCVAGLYGIKRADQEFTARRVDQDRLGFRHVRLTQRHQGRRVVGSELVVHFNKGGAAYEVNGSYVPDLKVDPVPALSAEAARARAVAWLREQQRPQTQANPSTELVVYARRTDPVLAYECVLGATSPTGTRERWRVWIRATDGSVLAGHNDTHLINAPTGNGSHVGLTGNLLAGEGGALVTVTGWMESASSLYYLHNTNRHWQVFNVATAGSYPDLNTYAHRNSTNWADSDRAEISLGYGFDLVQRYFRTVHNLDSFNNAGILAVANAHEGTSYVNAYWNGTAFYFGDGDNVEATSLAILDIAGHEYAHAVTEYSANLNYAYESGALNESFSDIFGTCIEFYGQPDGRAAYPGRIAGQADWLCGEDCWLSSTALRDLRNPAQPATVGAGNEQPSRYLGTYWYSGAGDNGGVHYNSGVQNFFFYLLCEGGTGTNDGLTYRVTGIGMTNAEQVAYRALTVYCTADTGYRAVRSAWLSAALDLDTNWATSVAQAWAAVGVDAVSISPAGSAGFSGEAGGPFAPSSVLYVLTNADVAAAGWGVTHTQNWLTVEPAAGTIPAGGHLSVTVSVNSAAHDLPLGYHADTLRFTNSGSSVTETRGIRLQVTPPAVYSFPLDSDPGWTTEGQWAFGVPTGAGDPAGGHTGANVYGYNLAGNYPDNMPAYYLTTPALDCSGLQNVQLSFWRWLAVESSTYDQAVVQASSDGSTWSTIWAHSGGTVQDSAWLYQSFDLSALADGQATVYVRWGLGPTDGSVTYTGWNLDDISILGQSMDDLQVRPGLGLAGSGYAGGPFSPTSQTYTVANASTNGSSLTWTARVDAAWVSVTSLGGTLAAGETSTVQAALSSALTNFTPGVYTASLVFSNTASGQIFTRALQVTVTEPLAVSPDEGLSASGYLGGPFDPDQKIYTITNRSAHSITWQASLTSSWVAVAPASGDLAASSSLQVTVAVQAAATSLPEGTYGDTLVISNTATTTTFTRPVQLQAVASSRISVTPGVLPFTNTMGSLSTGLLTVANGVDADAGLTFTISLHSSGSLRPTPSALAPAPEPGSGPAAARLDKPVPGFAYQPGELLVRLTENATAGQQQDMLARLGAASIARRFPTVPGLLLVKLPPTLAVTEALPALAGAPGLRYAQPNYRHRALDTLPDDAQFSSLWGLHNTGQSGGTVDADIDAPAAWDHATGRTNIIVCVVDTGIDYNHEDLVANLWTNPGELPANGLDDDGNGFIDDVHGINAITGSGDPRDDHDHGTHCAGTIGGVGHNATGVVGVCWQVRLMAAKFLDSSGSGTTADAITGIDYATRMGASVLNNSWGGGPYEQALNDAIAAAGSSGVVFAAAAGNDSMDTDTTANYPSCYTSANVIAVMSVDHNDVRSGFSNYGQQTVDLAAPGSSILSCQRGGGYQYMSGTSMATPHVAGASALLRAQNPTLPVEELRQVLMDTVDATLPGQCVSGGRLNLDRAVQALVPDWFEVQPRGATNLPAGYTTNLMVIVDAGGRAAGTYSGEVVLASNDLNMPEVRIPVVLTVLPDDLRLTPPGDFISSGITNGPFTPTSMVYAVSNAGPVAQAWSVTQTSSWAALSTTGGLLEAGATTSFTAYLTAAASALPTGTQVSVVAFSNQANGVVQTRHIRLTVRLPRADTFTELFAGDNQLDHRSLTLTPDGSISYYTACLTTGVTNFPSDPAGGTTLNLDDDDYASITWDNGLSLPFYGTPHTNLFVGSNGYLTFGSGDNQYTESLANHFNLPRLSAFFNDLNPATAGTVSWKAWSNRVAITYQAVPEYSVASTNTFQIELFSNGTLRITWLDLTAQGGLVGLSRGLGVPPDYQESTLGGYPECAVYVLLSASATGRGSISPTGTIALLYGSHTNFVVQAEPYFYLAHLLTNGASTGTYGPDFTNLVFWWSNITDQATVQAVFDPLSASNGTPAWWLAGHGLTNGTLDQAAAADEDDDGIPNGDEFVADTNPTNPLSRLQLLGVTTGSNGLWLSFGGASTSREYDVVVTTNLAAGTWTPLVTDLPGTNTSMAAPATANVPHRVFSIRAHLP